MHSLCCKKEAVSGCSEVSEVQRLYRCGRNYIEAGNYIERVFPFIGVRFIAINDSYDSKDQNQSDSLIIPFKNLINVRYSNLIPRYIGKTKIQMCQFA